MFRDQVRVHMHHHLARLGARIDEQVVRATAGRTHDGPGHSWKGLAERRGRGRREIVQARDLFARDDERMTPTHRRDIEEGNDMGVFIDTM